jgi:protein-disulfide isomerase
VAGSRTRRVALAAILALALVAPLIVASELGADRATPAPARPTTVTRAFPGIPQRGTVLGAPDAPVTLVEYADLQCPYCAEWARRTLPVLVSAYVRPGKLRIEFRGLAFIGPDSVTALRTAVAAGRSGRLWDVVDGLYLAQGAENGGWVSDSLIKQLAATAGLDYGRLVNEREQPWVARELERAAGAARAARVHGTPAFELGRTGRALRRIDVRSLDPAGITPAIESLLGS